MSTAGGASEGGAETPFPDGFLWGAATAAYQVEGSPLADGAGASIWHRFSHTPGRVAGGDTGDVACDHYRRFADDVALMRRLGLTAYRFSISWSRVFPEGTGRVNQAGLDFYRRLVDALLEAGIRPSATLYHWDLPAVLDDRGGWRNRDVAGWFADYATTCYRALPGVHLWATLNEPWVISDGGYMHGALAPGQRSAFAAAAVAHNLMRAHAAGVAAHRAEGAGGEIGLVLNIEPKHPASERPEDLAATARADAYMNRQYLEPALFGRYPEELREVYGQAWEERYDAEAAELAAPLDWLGINYYTRGVMAHTAGEWPLDAVRVRQPRATHTETGWEVYPDGLRETLEWVAGETRRAGTGLGETGLGDTGSGDTGSGGSGLPLYVTENGAAFYDPPTAPEGGVADPLRVDYYRRHLAAVARALAAGADVRGYFAWSLLDNLEWSLGYAKRFGIVHVDYATQRRTPKDSARFYSEVIRTNGACLERPVAEEEPAPAGA